MCQPGRPLPPRAVPRRLAGLRALPEREVGGVLLLLARLDARARQQRILRPVGELAVVALGADTVVHVRPLALRRRSFIRKAVLDEAADDLDHLRHFARGARIDVGRQHVQVAHVVHVQADELLDEFVGADLQPVRALDDAVVDVGEVLDVLDAVKPRHVR